MFAGAGTVINIITVVIGSLIGLFVGVRLPANINQLLMQALAAVTLLVGLQMALTAPSGGAVIIILIGLAAGAIIGELINLHGWLDRLGEALQQRLAARSAGFGRFTEGFVTASLLFCVGPMAILGSLQDGLMGDASVLLTKSALDGVAAVALTTTLGIGTMFSVVTIALYQGGLTLAAGLVRGLFSEPVIAALTATGGLMIVCLALNLFGLARIRVANLLPGLLTAGLLAALVDALALPGF